jgi:hypothetical protein
MYSIHGQATFGLMIPVGMWSISRCWHLANLYNDKQFDREAPLPGG